MTLDQLLARYVLAPLGEDEDEWREVTRAQADTVACQHPPERYYSWYARDDRAPRGRVLCVVCCDCGHVLLGGC